MNFDLCIRPEKTAQSVDSFAPAISTALKEGTIKMLVYFRRIWRKFQLKCGTFNSTDQLTFKVAYSL